MNSKTSGAKRLLYEKGDKAGISGYSTEEEKIEKKENNFQSK